MVAAQPSGAQRDDERVVREGLGFKLDNVVVADHEECHARTRRGGGRRAATLP